ncbi:MAG: energy transducer TonB [Gammaproteobacteria bacterium]|nr:energy transducer TonB [Gammaproteobacteria bacterium]
MSEKKHNPTPGLRFHANALLWMTLGAGSIFMILLYINQSAVPAPTERVAANTSFEVKQAIKPKPKKKLKKRKPRQHKKSAPSAPLANLDTTLSGIEFGLPSFSLDENAGVSQSLLGDTSAVVMTSDMVDVPPRVRKRQPLQYPARAKSKEIEGYVVISLLIGVDGKVEMVKVIEASPQGVFDDAALRSVSKWQFSPARYEGKAVETWANQTVRFELG